jgi:hypothetical protein
VKRSLVKVIISQRLEKLEDGKLFVAYLTTDSLNFWAFLALIIDLSRRFYGGSEIDLMHNVFRIQIHFQLEYTSCVVQKL